MNLFSIVVNYADRYYIIMLRLVLAVLLVWSHNVVAGNSIYVCNPDQAAYFKYSAAQDTWQPEVKNEGELTFVIQETYKGWDASVIGMGENTVFYCDISIMNKDVVYCTHETNSLSLEFNKSNLRYALSIVAGYAFDWYLKEGVVTPGVEIGRCVVTNG